MLARRILIVEDAVDTGETLADLLRLHGHTVELAHRALDGLRLAASFRPEVAILDIGLPDIDGYELARRLRAEPAIADCMLIAATAYGAPEDLERAAAAGFDVHFVKPVPLIRFLRALDEL